MQKILFSSLLIISLIGVPFALADNSQGSSKTFKLHFQDQNKEINIEDLGVSQDNSNNYTSFLHSLAGNNNSYTWDSDLSQAKIRELFSLNHPKDAEFVFDGTNLSVTEEVIAPKFDTEKILNDLSSNFSRSKNYRIKEVKWNPITKDDLRPYFDFVSLLLNEGIVANFEGNEIRFPIQIKDLVFEKSNSVLTLKLSQKYLDYLTSELDALISYPEENLIILAADLSKVGPIKTEGHLKNGFKLNANSSAKELQKAISQKSNTFIPEGKILEGDVINKTELDLGEMQLLSTGKSNFSNSPYGRDYNIRRALNEYYNAILIPAGANFSYNELLGPVTYSAGWKASLAIFLGTELEEVPGGGLCQVSTTMYRAAINAGLEILDQRNHSIYIDYYADYGDGLDATIFPGEQDLVFTNNTGSPILIESYDSADDAIVNFYGTSDGRIVSLEGPYTGSNSPQEVIDAIGLLRYYELAWKQTITWPDGHEEVNWLTSKYFSAVPQYKSNQ